MPWGTRWQEGDTVAILESMKMEMPVEAEDEGTVKEILVAEGQAVNEGYSLVVLEQRLFYSIYDRRAPGVVRVTIENAAKRNASNRNDNRRPGRGTPPNCSTPVGVDPTGAGYQLKCRLRHRQP